MVIRTTIPSAWFGSLASHPYIEGCQMARWADVRGRRRRMRREDKEVVWEAIILWDVCWLRRRWGLNCWRGKRSLGLRKGNPTRGFEDWVWVDEQEDGRGKREWGSNKAKQGEKEFKSNKQSRKMAHNPYSRDDNWSTVYRKIRTKENSKRFPLMRWFCWFQRIPQRRKIKITPFCRKKHNQIKSTDQRLSRLLCFRVSSPESLTHSLPRR